MLHMCSNTLSAVSYWMVILKIVYLKRLKRDECVKLVLQFEKNVMQKDASLQHVFCFQPTPQQMTIVMMICYRAMTPSRTYILEHDKPLIPKCNE